MVVVAVGKIIAVFRFVGWILLFLSLESRRQVPLVFCIEFAKIPLMMHDCTSVCFGRVLQACTLLLNSSTIYV